MRIVPIGISILEGGENVNLDVRFGSLPTEEAEAARLYVRFAPKATFTNQDVIRRFVPAAVIRSFDLFSAPRSAGPPVRP